jgi:hypothetical protein
LNSGRYRISKRKSLRTKRRPALYFMWTKVSIGFIMRYWLKYLVSFGALSIHTTSVPVESQKEIHAFIVREHTYRFQFSKWLNQQLPYVTWWWQLPLKHAISDGMHL